MKKIDLHAYTIDEALRAFTEFYNNSLGKESCLHIIHGYGSIGGTGKICDRLRKLLEEHSDKLRFTLGEEVEGNPGLTIVYPKKPLPSVHDGLSAEILQFWREDDPLLALARVVVVQIARTEDRTD